MTAKTNAELLTEVADKFRAGARTNQSLPEALTEFLNNLIDSVSAAMNAGSLVTSGAGAPVDYTDGDPVATGQDTAGPGTLYIDTTNAVIYRNDGTAAEPTWVALADAA